MSAIENIRQLDEWTTQKSFILGGDAIFTLVSTATGKRYTFRLSHPRARSAGEDVSNKWFAKLLTGPENTRDYQYLGMLVREDDGELKYIVTRKARLPRDSEPQKALAWVTMHLNADRPFPEELEFWHAGRCGVCGRTLTVPESIESGIGPVCAGRL